MGNVFLKKFIFKRLDDDVNISQVNGFEMHAHWYTNYARRNCINVGFPPNIEGAMNILFKQKQQCQFVSFLVKTEECTCAGTVHSCFQTKKYRVKLHLIDQLIWNL